MKASINVQDHIILRTFSGDIHLDDIMKSWEEIFSRFEDMKVFKGVITDLLEAEMHLDGDNMNMLVDFLKEYMDRMEGTKIAIVMDSPRTMTNTILMDQKMKHVQIKPFRTMREAYDWIAN